MGIYQKLGIRKLAVHTIDAITWIRLYGLKDGLAIFRSLSKSRNGFFKVDTPRFRNPVWLRDNHSDRLIFHQLFYEQQYRLDHFAGFNAERIIDAGSNVGLAAIYFATLYPAAQIIAIEPEAENFQLLKKNTAAYQNVECLHAALWHRQERISIKNPDSLAASFMVGAGGNAPVEAIPVEELLKMKQWERVDIFKIDIEGAEKEIFGANTDWLKKVKLLIIELHDHYKPGATKTFFKALEPYDYEAFFHHENIFILFK